MKCLNCNTKLTGSFCEECGQRTKVSRLNIKNVFLEIPFALFNLEQRYWHTIKDFIAYPVEMVKAYSDGKRKYYTPPIQFYFFFATLSMVLFTLTGDSSLSELSSFDEEDASTFLDKVKISGQIVGGFANQYSNYFELSLPLFSGVGTWIFFRRVLNLAESLAFSFYQWTFISILGIILLPLESFKWIGDLELILILAFLLYTFSHFTSQKIKGVSIGVFNLLFSSILFIGFFFSLAIGYAIFFF